MDQISPPQEPKKQPYTPPVLEQCGQFTVLTGVSLPIGTNLAEGGDLQ
jgi:hypothetical protein